MYAFLEIKMKKLTIQKPDCRVGKRQSGFMMYSVVCCLVQRGVLVGTPWCVTMHTMVYIQESLLVLGEKSRCLNELYRMPIKIRQSLFFGIPNRMIQPEAL